MQDYTEDTLSSAPRAYRLFLRWCAERGLTEPVEVTRPVLERYQRYLFHYRKKDGEPLSFASQHARLIALACRGSGG